MPAYEVAKATNTPQVNAFSSIQNGICGLMKKPKASVRRDTGIKSSYGRLVDRTSILARPLTASATQSCKEVGFGLFIEQIRQKKERVALPEFGPGPWIEMDA